MELKKFSSDESEAIADARKNPNDPMNQAVLKKYETMVSSGGYEPLAEPPSTLSKVAAGTAYGAMEFFNPLSAPHGIEATVRAFGQEADPNKGFFGRIAERMQKGSEQSVTAPATLHQIAPIVTSIGKKGWAEAKELFGGQKAPSLVDFYDAEKAKVEQIVTDPVVATSQGATEMAGAILTGVSALKNVAQNAPKFAQKVTQLKGLRAIEDAPKVPFDLKTFKESKSLQRQILGDLPKELEHSLYNNTAEVKRLLDGPQEGRSVMSTVSKIRESLSTNKEMLGEAIREFRYGLISERPDLFDSRTAQKSFQGFLNNQRLSGGTSTLTPKEANQAETIMTMLRNPKGARPTNQLDTRDAIKIIDNIDDYLKGQGFYEGKNVTTFNQNVSQLRQAMDAELANMYPAFKEVKGRYEYFLNNYQSLQSKIDGMGAESFVANLYGKNKTEVRQLLEDALKNGTETKDAFKNAIKDSQNISGISQANNDVLAKMRDRAEKIQFPEGKALMQEIADKSMARKLAEVSDPALDKLQRLQEVYLQGKMKATEGLYGKVGAGIGGVSGYLAGKVTGSPTMGATGGMMLGNWLSQSFSKASIAKNLPKWQAEAESAYSVERLLDTISKDKRAAEASRKLAGDMTWVFKTFGPESGMAFLNKIGLTPEVQKDFQRFMQATTMLPGATKGFAGSIERFNSEGGQ